MARDKSPFPGELVKGTLPDADIHLLAQLRDGDVEAGHRFVRDYYPAIYRYLLYLTRHRETAEDLTQETFLQAWRHLDQFQGRAPLRVWLHTIARREFLQAERRQRSATSLEEAVEIAEPHTGVWTDDVELRVILGTLPGEQQEVMLLSYLAGYSSNEIAQIIQAPARTVRHRLGMARAHLAQALGPGDLAYLNAPSVPMGQWAWLPLDQMYALETRLSRGDAGDWEAPESEPTGEESMERREFLRHAAVGAAGLALSDTGKDVVDGRLVQKVTLAFKATALSDLCEYLSKETGVHVAAGASVADEKVTLFCKQTPLRDVMRQLSRPFGYTWLRSQAPSSKLQAPSKERPQPGAWSVERGALYRYELVQDLRSQLLEEELRNRDRNAALLALNREIEHYRPFLSLSPDEALARAETAPAAEKRRLEALAQTGWGPIHMYFRLSPRDLEALRAGQWLVFSEAPAPGEQPLPPDLARGVLQSVREFRVFRIDRGYAVTSDLTDPRGVAPAADPEVRAQIKLGMPQAELGQFTLNGLSGYFTPRDLESKSDLFTDNIGHLASGKSPAILKPDNEAANAGLARDPSLRGRVIINLSPGPSPKRGGEVDGPSDHGATKLPLSVPERGPGGEVNPQQAQPTAEPKVTSADVLEALHRATGMPIVSDYYTRLYKPEAVSVQSMPLFDALNHLSDAMGLRWSRDRDGSWLQFRSASFFWDRLKEVPNRLLSRWAASRQRHGVLTLDDLVEIAQLTDAQLDAAEMAVGAQERWGLAEWPLARHGATRPHLRFLAEFTPEQRQETMGAAGLPFTRMSLAQQQKFLASALGGQPLQSMDELDGATLRVDYTQPGWFQWGDPGPHNALRWVIPLEPGRQGRRILRPPVRERTREAAVQAVRRVDPKIREALLQTLRRNDPRLEAAPPSDDAQIFPTRLGLNIVYIPGTSNARSIYMLTEESNLFLGS